MQNRVDSILRAINSNGKYNILTIPCHERYQSNWASMSHQFYMMQAKGLKTWNAQYAPMPNNYVMLDGTQEQLRHNLQFDIVLSQHKFGSLQLLAPIAQQLNIPLISLEHTLPVPEWNQKQRDRLLNMRGTVNVFISEYSINQWGFDRNDPSVRVVKHGINTDVFKSNDSTEKQPYALAICNDLKNRNWCCGYDQWVELTRDIPNKLIGDNPGLSKPAASVQELVNEYNKASVFVNSSLISPVPTVVMEAMSCGLPVVTLENCMLPEVVINGVNGFISNDINYLRDKIKLLLNDKNLRSEMGKNARQTIIEKFSLDQHLNLWNKIFSSLVGRGYHS
jgi:hypothetical protein